MEYSGIGRNKEQAAKMLGHLVATAPRLIRPYMEPVLKVRSRSLFNVVDL
jgi:FKBP12-rapamycin complex-associated protein